MKNKKFKLLQILSCGMFGIGATTVGTAIILNTVNNSPSNDEDTRIDLSIYSGPIVQEFSAVPTVETLRSAFAVQNGLEHCEDLEFTIIDPQNNSFRVSAINNSSIYKNNAQCT
jgi:hypothetical protein